MSFSNLIDMYASSEQRDFKTIYFTLYSALSLKGLITPFKYLFSASSRISCFTSYTV